jgi:hypothetical protein
VGTRFSGHLRYLHAALEDGCNVAQVLRGIERIGVQD